MSKRYGQPIQFMPSESAHQRADGLDALRGYAILTMALSGMVPWGTLPQWMYHAQLIAPQMKYDLSVPGLTWVDLVFPFFLFSMGAAMPLALTRRLGERLIDWRVLFGLSQRLLLLTFFAIYVRHISPTVIANPVTTRALLLGLLGFLLLFPTLTRLPKEWSGSRQFLVRAAGWASCIVYLLWLNYEPKIDSQLWLTNIVRQRDIIILVLANTVFTGGLVWMLTRRWVAGRLCLMIAILAFRLSHDADGWTHAIWTYSPSWMVGLYQFPFQQYLLIVIPGTIAGDLLLRRLNHSTDPVNRPTKNSATEKDHITEQFSKRYLTTGVRLLNSAVALISLALILTTVVGLQARGTTETVLTVASLMILLFTLYSRTTAAPTTECTQQLMRWGALWLVIGLAFEPYEGGIKKDSATISYYFVTSGLACFALAFFQCSLEIVRTERPLRWLIETGQNPMMAYVAIRSFLRPVVELTHLDPLMKGWLSAPWAGVAWACAKVLLLAWFVSWMTRRRVFWRT